MVSISIDTSGLEKKLRQLSTRGIAFAAVNAANEASKRLQIELQSDIRSRFEVRSEFVIRQGAVIRFASFRPGRDVFAEIGVGIGQTSPARFLLGQFEEGGPRAAVTGSPRSAVPVPGGPARPSRSAKIPAGYQYTALRLRREGRASGRKGARKTFELRREDGTAIGVFQRTGKGPRGIRAVFIYENQQRVDSRLDYAGVSRRFGARFLREELERAIAREIARAQR